MIETEISHVQIRHPALHLWTRSSKTLYCYKLMKLKYQEYIVEVEKNYHSASLVREFVQQNACIWLLYHVHK